MKVGRPSSRSNFRFFVSGGMALSYLVTFTSLALHVGQVNAHGRLAIPPSRATAWRYGFGTPEDFNDHELYCGGWSRQHQRNKGLCGVCGDAYDLPQPRPHENGGKYGQGTIVKTYKVDTDIEIGVELTANHQGYFEFRLCPLNQQAGGETDQCFDQHVLQRSDGQGTRYYPGPGSGIIFKEIYKLPAGLQCSQCVLQWRYVAGNNWGTCPNGTGMIGCGPQEQFRACSDIRITDQDVPEVIPTTSSTTSRPSTTSAVRTRGTVTSRFTRLSTTTTPATPSTTASTTSKPEGSTEHPAGTHDASEASPGPYAGIIIALASLLFAILLMCCIILYFYRGHQKVKEFLGQRFRRQSSTFKSRSSSNQPTKTLRLPASVLAHHTPQQLTTSNDVDCSKPQVPARPKRSHPPPLPPPPPPSVRQLALTISEPLDVTINGVSVPRDEHVVAGESQ